MRRLIKGSALLLAVSFTLTVFSGCDQTPETTAPTTQTEDPSDITPTDTVPQPTEPTPQPTDTEEPSASPEPTLTPVPTPRPMTDLAELGYFRTGFTLAVPGGKWYDVIRQPRLYSVDDLTVEASETGKPTFSQQSETSVLLSLTDSNNITFKGIRFGYEKPDYQDDVRPGVIPLVEIIESRNIRFEDCEFFGSAGAAIRLAGSANIEFINCQFYNNAGLPVQTDNRSQPSQVLFQQCSFESPNSGMMPLHLRNSVFDGCTFVGLDGYLVPALETGCASSTLYAAELYRELTGVLAARIEYLRDDYQVLTLKDSMFVSRDIYSLYDRLEREVLAALPSGWLSVALTGEKTDDPDAEKPLSATLGLKLHLRTQSNNGAYNLPMLRQDLQPLRDLPDIVYELITGDIEVVISDQYNDTLLQGQIPLERLQTLLDDGDPRIWIDQGIWTLLSEDLVPELFAGLEVGRISARDARQVLSSSWPYASAPMFFAPSSDPDRQIMIETDILYRGTDLAQEAAYHNFDLLIQRSTRSDLPDCLVLLPAAEITYQAINGEKNDVMGRRPQSFMMPDQLTRQALLSVLSAPVVITATSEVAAINPTYRIRADDDIKLSLPAAENSAHWPASPILVEALDEDSMQLKLVLYDTEIRPWLVRLALIYDGDGIWQIDELDIITNNAG